VPAALDGVRSLGIDGLSVTMPHQDAVAAGVDDLSDDARVLGAVNCVVRDGSRLTGHNTDGPGFLGGLRAEAGLDVAGARCVVLGAGGAARAVIRSLAVARGDGPWSTARRTGEAAARLAGAVGRVGAADDVTTADLLVNATSVGMGAEPGAPGPLPIAAELLHGGLVVADLVMHPVTTPLLQAAAERDATPVDGLGMLVHQAALAFELWTGVAAPLEAMTAAAAARLA
jgi:shikimate dehydrogenase